MAVPSITLNNGIKIPQLGLGTWKSAPGLVEEAVKNAIDCGYRHIDCAFVYGNENEVGDAIQAKILDGTVKREDLFITSKLWNTFHSPAHVEMALRKSLKNLKLDYLDLYLIHWPMGYKEDGDNLFPKDSNDQMIFSDVDYILTYQALEDCVDKKIVKSIGLSNFNSKQIERVLAVSRIHPVMNQFECHPYLNQKKLIEFCKSKNIAVTGYSPLGSPDRPWAKPTDPDLLNDEKIVEMAKKYKVSTAQILIRYQIQRGIACIPKSVTKSRIESNFDVFKFAIDPQDMSVIDTFDMSTKGRLVALGLVAHHPHYPFNEEF